MTSNTDDSIVCQTDCKQNKLLLIECIKCQQRFENLLDNYNHFLDKHKEINENPIEVNDNQKDIEESPKLRINMRVHKSKRKPKEKTNVGTDGEKRFFCDFQDCRKSYTRSTGLKCHLEVHIKGKGKKHICGYQGCTRAYARRDDLLVHRKLHTNPSICDICGKHFDCDTRLKQHKVVHSEDRPFPCQWPGCDVRSKTKGAIDTHIQTHTKDRRFECDYEGCPQTYTSQTILNQHKKRQHLKIRKEECLWPGCDSKFVNKSELKCHMTFHTNERNFACDWPDCEKRFPNSTILKKHRYTHTGERPFPCLIDGCTAAFACRGTLGTHKKLIHKCNEIKRSRWDRPKRTIIT